MSDLTLNGNLLAGRRGLVMGVANNHSIAWGIARVLAANGAELAFTYQNEAFEKRVRPLADSLGTSLVVKADVEDDASLDNTFEEIGKAWDRLDFVVHAVAFSDKNELKGRYVDTSRGNFRRSLEISCFSFTDIARRAEPLLRQSTAPGGASLITLTYLGAVRAMPNYNVMGVAKAALEASVRYMAVDLGADGIRVNGLSAGPMRTLAGSAIGDARMVLKWNRLHSALKKNVELDEVGGAALYLLSDLSAGVTGEIHYVDSGYNIIAMPRGADLMAQGMSDHGLQGNGANGHE